MGSEPAVSNKPATETDTAAVLTGFNCILLQVWTLDWIAWIWTLCPLCIGVSLVKFIICKLGAIDPPFKASYCEG